MTRRFLTFFVVLYAAVVVLVVLVPRVFAKPTPPATCNGTLSHATTADLTVPSGSVCRVSGSTVNGSVTVQRNAYFEAWDTKISGAVNAAGALTVFLHDGTSVGGNLSVDATPQLFLYRTTVGGMARVTGAVAPGYGHVQVCDTTAGGIEIRGSGPDVLVGDPRGACPGNRVKRDIVIVDNNTISELGVSGNTVAGSLVVTGNSGSAPKRVMNNVVQGRVDLSNNSAPFEGSPAAAGS